MNDHHTEAPGICPVCGEGRMLIRDYSFWNDPYSGNTKATLFCRRRQCCAEIKVSAPNYSNALVDAINQEYRKEDDSFRDSVGGFQFSD